MSFLPSLLSAGTRRMSFSMPSAVIMPSVGSSTVPVSPDFFEAVMAQVVRSIVPVASMAVLLRTIFDSGASAVKFAPFLMVRCRHERAWFICRDTLLLEWLTV